MRRIKDTRPDYIPRTLRPRDDRPDAWRKKVEDRKERFETLNRFVTRHGGWVTSVPGAMDVTIEVTETSNLPEKLRDLGYEPVEIGRRERMIPNATTEDFTSNAHGEMVLVNDPAGRVVSRRVAHAGLVPVIIYDFAL